MPNEHSYRVFSESIGKNLISMSLEGMDDVKVTSASDWWSEAPEGMFSPQTLFVSASGSCLILSLFKVTERMRIDFKHATVDALGEMEEVDGVWKFEKITLNAKVTIDDDSLRPKMEKAIKMAHDFCPIQNSLGMPSILNYEIEVEE
jgi:uncharacterized OsmC-like protein